MQEERTELLKDLINKIQESGIQNERQELITLVCDFLYTIGSSLENNIELSSSYEVLMRYAQDPTLGNALMAQSIQMKETWLDTERKPTDGKPNRIVQGKTKEE